MSKKDKSQRGHGGGKQQASGAQREDPFFRPFAKLPSPAKKPETAPGQPSGAQDKRPAATGRPSSAQDKRPAAPPARPVGKKQAASEDDSLTFERFMSGVTPLDPFAVRRIPASSEDPGAPPVSRMAQRSEQLAADDLARDKLRALVEEGSRFEVTDDGRRIEGRRRGVDGGLVRKLRAGELPVDATLDLLASSPSDARARVEDFVRDRRVRGDRVVLIVHARGRGSHGQGAVLRGELAAWLAEGNASTHVSAFVTAPEPLGGEGSMCVLLAGARDDTRRM
ncbi:MAG TPA: Smr/MutS family protein [Polyangiaceae bacterium]|nr:Smr/MutS family protein [Polyangiaceae bacterium]